LDKEALANAAHLATAVVERGVLAQENCYSWMVVPIPGWKIVAPNLLLSPLSTMLPEN
jgi:hypothetical protein